MVKEYEYAVCPLCFLNKKIISAKKGKISFGNFDLNNNLFIQTREQRGGTGTGGFFKVDGKCLTIKEASSIQEYRDLLQQIDDFCKNWLKFRKLKT